MSGGLDSPAVAAFARKARPEIDLRAYTAVYDSLIPDNERHFAGLVAEFLCLPIEFTTMDEARPYELGPGYATPEPVHDPLSSFNYRFCRGVAAQAPVILTGHGADPLFSLSPLTNLALMRAIPPIHTSVNFARYIWEFRTMPRFRLRSTLRHLLGRVPVEKAEIPTWLSPALVGRCGLGDRAASPPCENTGPKLRPLARRVLSSVFWPSLFETEESAYFGAAFEYRHAFFDLRVASYLFAIPELPWSMDKYLLRASLRGMLPETVRKRPKTPLRANPLIAAFRKHGLGTPQPVLVSSRLCDFINSNSIPVLAPDSSPEQFWINSRVLSLNCWFQSQEQTRKCKPIKTIPRGRHTTLPNCESMAISLK